MAFWGGFSQFSWRGAAAPQVIAGPNGEWLLRSAGGYVACYEATEAAYQAAATSLSIPEAVQTAAWAEALLGGSRLFIPQSMATAVTGGVAHCDLGYDPYASINFDAAQAACWAMGPRWSLMSQAQGHVISTISQAYWAGQGKANPTGNTQHGRSSQVTSEVGVRSDSLPVTGSAQGTQGRTLTGQRAAADGGGLLLPWSHDGTASGVFDLVGNVWEWSSRFRIVDWEIQIIPASAGVQADHGASSTAWRAMLADGTLVDPGTASTLKYSTDSGVYLSTTQAGAGNSALFKDVGPGAISPVPPMLIAMGLAPWSSSAPTVGRFYVNNSGERMPRRGGDWTSAALGGAFAMGLTNGRASGFSSIGFRPAVTL